MPDAFVRHYPHGSLAAQLLGYVSEVSPQELKHPPTGVRAGDKIGQSGIEGALTPTCARSPAFSGCASTRSVGRGVR